MTSVPEARFPTMPIRFPLVATLCAALSACGAGEPARAAAEQPAAEQRAEAAAPVGCRRTDAPATSDSFGLARFPGGARYACVGRAGEPPLRVTMDADAEGVPRALRVFAAADGTRPPQVLDAPLDGFFVPAGAEVVDALDMDADGWAELRLLDGVGSSGNSSYHVWTFDPARRRFVASPELSAITSPEPVPGRPCVHSRANGGHAGMLFENRELCRQDGRWVEVSRSRQDWVQEGDFYLLTVWERRGDSLAVVRVDTIPADSVRG
jgi:hypothetical protein